MNKNPKNDQHQSTPKKAGTERKRYIHIRLSPIRALTQLLLRCPIYPPSRIAQVHKRRVVLVRHHLEVRVQLGRLGRLEKCLVDVVRCVVLLLLGAGLDGEELEVVRN